MTTRTAEVTGAALKRAIETRDGHMLADFYADTPFCASSITTIRPVGRARSKAARQSPRSGTTSAGG